MKRRNAVVVLLTAALALAVSGCQIFSLWTTQRLGRLDIVGATGLYIGDSGSRSTGSLNRLFKVMPDGTHQVVEEYNERMRSFEYDKQIAAIYDLNDEWVMAGYGWDGRYVEEAYLVSKSTGNVFFLSEIVTFYHDYWNDYWSSTTPFYVFGDTMYIMGNPWNEDQEWIDWERKGVYSVDLSSTGRVTGTTLVEYTQPYDIYRFLAAPNGALLFEAYAAGFNQAFIRTPSGALKTSTAWAGDMFTTGTNSFFHLSGSQLTEYRVSHSDYTVHTHSTPSVGSLRPRNVVAVDGRALAFGSAGVVDLTDPANATLVATFSMSQLIFAVPFSTSEVAIYYHDGLEYALDVFDITTGARTNVFGNSAYILDSLAAGDGILYMGGINGATSRQTIATYDGTTVTASDLENGAGVVIITPIN